MRGESPREEGSAHDITRLLSAWTGGNPAVAEELFAGVYPELKRIARARMRAERGDHTLQPSALVSEFFVRVARWGMQFTSRGHFLAVASMAMRRILVDHARSRKCAHNGSGAVRLRIDDLPLPAEPRGPEVIEIHELLSLLEREHPRCARVVEMRCFGGLTNAEIAEALSRDERTIKRDWRFARAWMLSRLTKESLHDANPAGSRSRDLR